MKDRQHQLPDWSPSNGRFFITTALSILVNAMYSISLSPSVATFKLRCRTIKSNPVSNNARHVERKKQQQISSLLFASLYEDAGLDSDFSFREDRKTTNKRKYLQGDQLMQLREDILTMRWRLKYSVATKNADQVQMLQSAIEKFEEKDAELMFARHQQKETNALREGRLDDAIEHKKEALLVRNQVPHLRMEGLWVGRFRPEALEAINVTYVEDTLIATKVAGGSMDGYPSLKRGEVAFVVDMKHTPVTIPSVHGPASKSKLHTVEMRKDASEMFGVTHARRFPGAGGAPEKMIRKTGQWKAKQDTAKNSRQWKEGEMIMLGENHFSFAWLQLQYQVFFARPPPSLVLQMLAESYKIEDCRAALERQDW